MGLEGWGSGLGTFKIFENNCQNLQPSFSASSLALRVWEAGARIWELSKFENFEKFAKFAKFATFIVGVDSLTLGLGAGARVWELSIFEKILQNLQPSLSASTLTFAKFCESLTIFFDFLRFAPSARPRLGTASMVVSFVRRLDTAENGPLKV